MKLFGRIPRVPVDEDDVKEADFAEIRAKEELRRRSSIGSSTASSSSDDEQADVSFLFF